MHMPVLPHATRRVRLFWPAALVLSCVVGSAEALRWGRASNVHWWADGGWTLAALIAALCCLHTVSRVRGNERIVWALFAGGCSLWLASQLARDYYDIVGRFPAPPTVFDIGFLGFAVAFIVGLVALATGTRLSRFLLVLDVGTLAVVFTIVWLTVFKADLEHSHLSNPGQATALLHPIVYSALMAALLLLPMRKWWRSRSLWLLRAGLLAQTIPWILWTPLVLRGTFVPGTLLDNVWMLGLLLIGAGALSFRGFPAVDAEAQIRGPLAIVPLVMAFSVVVVVVLRFTAGNVSDGMESLLMVLVAAILLPTCLRLWLTVRDSRSLLMRSQSDTEALEESREQYRELFENATDIVFTLRLDGTFTAINKVAERISGYSRDEAVTMNIAEVLTPQTLDVAQKMMTLKSEGAPATSYEVELVTRQGRVVPLDLHTRIIARGGRPVGIQGIARDITERKLFEEQLKHQVLHDALTGLPNRMLLEDRLEQAIRSAHRGAVSLALLLLDLDHFKEINDTLGHHAGDAMLREVAQRLFNSLRASDTVARLGGDEFAIILTAVDQKRARLLAQKIHDALREPLMVEGHRVDMGASIGIALYPMHGEDATTLLRHSDVAMYTAKRAGHGHSTYAPAHDLNSASRLALLADLRAAVEHEELSLHFQPKVNLTTEALEQVEALVRWTHPRHGVISPAEFVPLAETAGVAGALTLFVLKSALQQCAAWHAAGLKVSVAVNLSTRSLHDPDLPNTIAWILRGCKLEASRLILEINESTLMADPDASMAVLEGLNKMGVVLSIDDFGTGYSSLAYLSSFPISELKIDQSLVGGMARNGGAIVRSIIDLGRGLGMQVTAQGVEEEDTYAALIGMGCMMAQGYHVCRPVPAEEILPWARRREQSRLTAMKGSGS